MVSVQKKNEVKATELYHKAAEQGDVRVLYTLGVCYENGIGMEKDEVKAIEWYCKAAAKGNDDALKCLGYYYLKSVQI